MGSSAQGYVKEFTRHSSDILHNLDELRKRQILTDVCLLVDGRQLRAHKVVLMACSGYFYSIFLTQGRADQSVLPLSDGIELRGFEVLLDFMYTSRLALSVDTIRSVLAAAEYLRMDHVVDTCRHFIQTSFDHSSLCHAPSVTDGLANAASVQDREGAHQHAAEVQRVLPPSQTAHKTTPTSASTAADSCIRASVLRCPDSWDWSPAGMGGIPTPGCAFQQVSGLSCTPADTSAMFHKGSVQSNPTGRESVQQMKEEPARAGEECKADGRARNYVKPSIQTPNSPTRSDGHPNSPTESSTIKCHAGLNSPDPKACNWKKYKFIVLNSLKQEKEEGQPAAGLMTGKPAALHPFQSQARDRATSEEDAHAKPLEIEQFNLHLGCPARAPPFCFVCGQQFLGLSQLRHHMIYSHPGEEPTEYPPERTDYRTGEKPYRCCICSAQFNRPANLKTHSRIHSGEKPYKCETCGSCFVQVAHLRAHVLIHTGEKPYPCETCGTRFRHLQTLKSHIRIHTGEKPYHCKICDLHFRHKSQLRLHMRQKHGAITNTKIRYKVLSGPYAAVGAF